MLFNPAVMALITASFLVGAYTLYASGVGIEIILKWDIQSASEKQLALERKTYLVSTILGNVMAVELVSLFLFVAVADHLHTFFTGAMCAAGTLNVNGFGLATLAVKMASFFLCAVWLVVNHVDNLASDYPLIRFKYAFLALICLMLVAECIMQTRYLLGLDPQVITSCCGSLFGENARGLAAEMSHLPPAAAGTAFYAATVLMLSTGICFRLTGKCGWLYGLLSVAAFPLALAALTSCFCLYFYELPTHHCPFCLLQKEYHFVGYFLYGFLLAGTVSGAASGMVGMFKNKVSLQDMIPRVQKRLCNLSMLAYGSFALWVSYPVVFSDFTLTGY